MANMNSKEAADLTGKIRQLNEDLGKTKGSFNAITKSQQEQIILEQQRSNIQEAINALQKEQIAGNEDITDSLKELLQQKGDLLNKEKKLSDELKKGNIYRRQRNNLTREFTRQLKIGVEYLMQSDKIIRQTILNLGMSGVKAEMMRESFQQSAGYVARLGGNMENILETMTGFADRTGRARVLTGEMVEQIAQIGKGTAIGVEQATLLAAQFEFMGVDVSKTMEYVQGVVDTSERMGVNTTKVLKNINDNFKKLNTYTFRQGIAGLAEMAQYAEKFRVDITEALSAVDVARNLEGAIDLAAQLQIMGGEFAKTDPFEMLFLARNDPAEFTKKISEMTRGVVTFRKMADGSFEKFISPADRDRLRNVAQSLNMSLEEITEIAQRRAEMDKMARQMQGMGLTDREKDLIEGAAMFDSSQGKFMVQIGTQMKDITNLNATQAKTLSQELSTLEERALAAQTFETSLKATIDELKTALLPILKSINKVLNTIRPMIINFTEWVSKGERGWLKVAGLFLSAGLLWKGILRPLAGRIGGATVGRLSSAIRGSRGMGAVGGIGAGQPGSMFTKTGMIRKGAPQLLRGQGAAGFGKGAAGLGIGAGIAIAAGGIGKMAESMAKLDKTQIWALPVTMLALAASFWALSPSIVAAGAAGTAGAVGLLAVGAAVVGIGFGINLATKGIGKMAEGLGEMLKNAKGTGKDMLQIGGGIAAIGAGLALMTVGAGGLFVFGNLLKKMEKRAESVERVGLAFQRISTVMSGSKDDYVAIQNAVESISGANIKGSNVITDLVKLLKTPLKVEFTNKQVAIVSNITLEIDGEKFHQATRTGAYVRNSYNDAKTGKGGIG